MCKLPITLSDLKPIWRHLKSWPQNDYFLKTWTRRKKINGFISFRFNMLQPKRLRYVEFNTIQFGSPQLTDFLEIQFKVPFFTECRWDLEWRTSWISSRITFLPKINLALRIIILFAGDRILLYESLPTEISLTVYRRLFIFEAPAVPIKFF